MYEHIFVSAKQPKRNIFIYPKVEIELRINNEISHAKYTPIMNPFVNECKIEYNEYTITDYIMHHEMMHVVLCHQMVNKIIQKDKEDVLFDTFECKENICCAYCYWAAGIKKNKMTNEMTNYIDPETLSQNVIDIFKSVKDGSIFY